MYNQPLALITSFLAMAFVVISYFLKNKSMYLLFQALNMCCLVISYFFSLEFFAMIGLAVSLIRTLTFFVFEEKGRTAPLSLAFVFAGLTVGAYVVVNLLILGNLKLVDIICVVALVSYSFIFRIRNLKLVRYLMLFPLALSVVYNLLCAATIFVVCSYAFEILADVVAIIKSYISKTNEMQDDIKLKENS